MNTIIPAQRIPTDYRLSSSYLEEAMPHAGAIFIVEKRSDDKRLAHVTQIAALSSTVGAIIGMFASAAVWPQSSLSLGLSLIPHIAFTAVIVGAWLGSLLWDQDA